jgi:hypothetical protein
MPHGTDPEAGIEQIQIGQDVGGALGAGDVEAAPDVLGVPGPANDAVEPSFALRQVALLLLRHGNGRRQERD